MDHDSHDNVSGQITIRCKGRQSEALLMMIGELIDQQNRKFGAEDVESDPPIDGKPNRKHPLGAIQGAALNAAASVTGMPSLAAIAAFGGVASRVGGIVRTDKMDRESGDLRFRIHHGQRGIGTSSPTLMAMRHQKENEDTKR